MVSGQAVPRRLEAAQGDRGAWARVGYLDRACWPTGVPDIGAGGPRCQSTHAVMNKAVVVLVDCNLRTGPTQLRGG